MNELRIKEYSYYQKKTGKRMSMPTFENMESFGYAVLQTPLTSLIISYPIDGLKDYLNNIPKANINNMQFEEISSNQLLLKFFIPSEKKVKSENKLRQEFKEQISFDSTTIGKTSSNKKKIRIQ